MIDDIKYFVDQALLSLDCGDKDRTKECLVKASLLLMSKKVYDENVPDKPLIIQEGPTKTGCFDRSKPIPARPNRPPPPGKKQ